MADDTVQQSNWGYETKPMLQDVTNTSYSVLELNGEYSENHDFFS